ncbi:MAG: BamA/TamA family outer membrane protein, partial [Prevotellaceae bacterium]|nr:BamA/TamA family outer membrane protein [Prevotellaceae bacterium]
NTAQGILAFGNDDNGKFQLQGEVQLQLHNLFKGGEEFALNWQSSGNSSQILHLHVSVPYLIFGVLGVAASFDIDRRDSLYINTGGQIGLNTRVGNFGKASLYVSMHRNNNTSGIEKNTIVNLTKYGISYEYTKYDSYLIPRKGLNLTLDISAGTRKVTGSALTANKNGGSIEALLHASYLQPLSNLIGLQLKMQGQAKELFSSSEELFLSELYTIGGTYTLRGFNERSIFASSYVIATIEPRLYYGANSYLLALLDYAIAQSKRMNSNNTNQLFSFGVGTQFETRAGIFSVTYALGKDFDNSISFRDSKIHLGYKAVF